MFQISWFPNTPPPSPTHFIPQCLYVLLLLSCTFGLILIFHGLYNVSRSLCSPGGPTYVPSPSVSYFRCFLLSLICTFVVSYFLYFVVSQFRYFTLQLCHTLWFRPFAPVLCSPILIFHGPMVPGLYVPQYLCSPIPMFPVLCSPILRLHGPNYVPRSLCSSLPMFPNTYIIPGSYVLRSLCSPVPMFPNPYVPRSLCSPALCSPIL